MLAFRKLGFDGLDEGLQYILDSDTNGQREQVRRLFKSLSARQQVAFANYTAETGQRNQALKIINYCSEK
jgi:hypothetical protein